MRPQSGEQKRKTPTTRKNHATNIGNTSTFSTVQKFVGAIPLATYINLTPFQANFSFQWTHGCILRLCTNLRDSSDYFCLRAISVTRNLEVAMDSLLLVHEGSKSVLLCRQVTSLRGKSAFRNEPQCPSVDSRPRGFPSPAESYGPTDKLSDPERAILTTIHVILSGLIQLHVQAS